MPKPDLQIAFVFFLLLVVLSLSANAQRPEKTAAPRPNAPPAKVQGFEMIKPQQAPRGFGPAEPADASKPQQRSSSNGQSRERARRYARSLIRRYDKNKNGHLERDEWRRIRGNPANSDANGDGILTAEEITNRVASRPPRSRAARSSSSNPSTSKSTTAKTASNKPNKLAKGQGSEKDRNSYRFTPAAERLPKGLPSWFKQRDKDKDGQVAMHEYASKWSARTVREFDRYDKDGDGLITPGEAKRR